MRHSEIQIYRKGTHNSDQKTHLLDHLFMRWFVILGSNPRRFIMFPKNGGDLCANGRVGQAHTDLFMPSTIHILELPRPVNGSTEFRATTKHGEEAPRLAARMEK